MTSSGQPSEQLRSAVKQAISLARQNQWDEFFATYATLFAAPWFTSIREDDQRQALRLMITTKGLPPPSSASGVQAYQSGWYVLNRLIQAQNNPHDYELMGMTHLRLGDEDGARRIFQAGHELALQHNDAELCGAFLRHLSTL